MTLFSFMLTRVGMLACVGADTKETCAELSVERCAEEPACRTLDGGELTIPDTGGEACYNVGSAEPLGCADQDIECTQAITFAMDPSGTGSCYQFNNGCIPEGWVTCEPDYNEWSEC